MHVINVGNLVQTNALTGITDSAIVRNSQQETYGVTIVNTPADLDRRYAMIPSAMGGKVSTVWASSRQVTVEGQSYLYGKTTQHLFRDGEKMPWMAAQHGDLTMTFSDGDGALVVSIYSPQAVDGQVVQKTLTADTELGVPKVSDRKVERTVVVPKGSWVSAVSHKTSFVVMTESPVPGTAPTSEMRLPDVLRGYVSSVPYVAAHSADSLEKLVSDYGMRPHPEGGYVTQFHDSAVPVILENGESRTGVNNIYYLIPETTVNKLHRIRNGDESWTHCGGGAYEITLLSRMADRTAHIQKVVLGKNLSRGEVHSVTVPEGTWMTGKPIDGTFTLVAIASQPGFTLDDFEAGTPTVLCQEFSETIVAMFETRLFPDAATDTLNANDFSHLSDGVTHPNELKHQTLMQILVNADISAKSPEERFVHYASVFKKRDCFASSCGGLLIPSAPTIHDAERLFYLHDQMAYSPWHRFRIEPDKPQVTEVYRFVDGDSVSVNLFNPDNLELTRHVIRKPGDTVKIPPGQWFSAEIINPMSTAKPWAMIVVEVDPKFDPELHEFPKESNLAQWPQKT